MKIKALFVAISFGIIGIIHGQQQGIDADTQDIDHVDTKTVIVPIENKLDVQEKPQPVYTLFGVPHFDGQKVLKDVQNKMVNVVEKFSSNHPDQLFQSKHSPSLRNSNDETPTTFSNLYNSLPSMNLDSFYDNVNNAIPDVNAIITNLRDTANTIDFTPVRAAAQDIVVVLPTVAILSFYGLIVYFLFALLFRAAGFAIATKMNTLRLASDVFMQAPEFVSRMMMGDTNGLEEFQSEGLSRSDSSDGNMNLMNLLQGAQKVSEAIEKYNVLNQS